MNEQARKQTLLVLFLGVLLAALDIAIIGPALPALGKYFAINERGLAWVFTIYVLFNLLGSPLMAKLSDRYGRRTIYVLDIVLFALGSLVIAFSPNFSLLLFGRALQGLGAGGIFPVAGAVIGETFPPEKRGSALGLIGAVFGIAFIIGPILGGILLIFGWQWLFLVNLPLAAVLIWLSWRTLPQTRPVKHLPFDKLGLFLLTIFLGGFTLGITELDTYNLAGSFLSWQVWPFFLLAFLALPILIWQENRAADPLIRPGLLRTRQLALANLVAVGSGVGEATIVFLPPMAVAAFKLKESEASFLLLLPILAMAVSSPLAGRGLDKFGSKRVIWLGATLFTVGVFGLGFFGQSFWYYLISAMIAGLSLGILLGAPVRYIMLKEAAAPDRAAAQSMITISSGIGQMLGSATVGAVVASAATKIEGYTHAYLLTGVAGLVLVGLTFGLKNRQQERAELPATQEQSGEFTQPVSV